MNRRAFASAATVTLLLGLPAVAAQDAVVYFTGDQTQAAFAKGQPLTENAKYKIHASRREAPGQAEVHGRDTDIIYVLDGTATVVTGGTATGATAIADAELRGPSIDRGTSRTLSKGDVLVVPHGTPHQFTQVRAPFLYYVVKVTTAP